MKPGGAGRCGPSAQKDRLFGGYPIPAEKEGEPEGGQGSPCFSLLLGCCRRCRRSDDNGPQTGIHNDDIGRWRHRLNRPVAWHRSGRIAGVRRGRRLQARRYGRRNIDRRRRSRIGRSPDVGRLCTRRILSRVGRNRWPAWNQRWPPARRLTGRNDRSAADAESGQAGFADQHDRLRCAIGLVVQYARNGDFNGCNYVLLYLGYAGCRLVPLR